MDKDVMKLDKKDMSILFELDLNARLPLSELGRRVGLSPQTTKYRLEQLEKKGVIRGYVTFFDVSKFDYLYYRLYVRYENVTIEEENRILDFLKKHRYVVWFISTAGRWDLEVLFVARNFIHFNQILKDIYEKFPDKLQNNVTSVSIENYHHKRGYLMGKSSPVRVSYGGEPSRIILDGTDRKIMGLINQNARMSSSEIGMKLGLNYKTIQSRIRRMEERGIIQAYRTWLDFFKIGYRYYKSLIKLRKLSKEEERKMLKFCRDNPNIIYFIICAWPWDVEIEVEAKSEIEFLEIMRSFRELFGELIIDYETLTIYGEHKLNYYPFEKLYEKRKNGEKQPQGR